MCNADGHSTPRQVCFDAVGGSSADADPIVLGATVGEPTHGQICK